MNTAINPRPECVGVGTGSCTYGPEAIVDATVLDPTPVTTTTSSTTTSTTSTTVAPVVVTTVAPVVVIPPSNTTTSSTSAPQINVPIVEVATTTTEPIQIVIPEIPAVESTTSTTLAPMPGTTTTVMPPVQTTTTTLPKPVTTTSTQFNLPIPVATTVPGVIQPPKALEVAVLNAVIAQVSIKINTPITEVNKVLNQVVAANVPVAQFVKVMDAVFTPEASKQQVVGIVDNLLKSDLSEEELATVFNAVFDDDLSSKETVAMAESILTKPLDDKEFGTVINAIFDEKVSDEVLVGTFSAVLETKLTETKFAEVVNVLGNASIIDKQVSQVVDLIVSQDGGVSGEQATELAASAKVLESIDGEQATAVFAAVVVSEVSEEEGTTISEALAEAPTDVKESFEEEINVFAGVFDAYTAVGSSIDVGTRRSVIAVNLVASTVALAAAAGAVPTPGQSPSHSAPRQDVARKEEEQEASGEIAGDGPNWIKGLSIYRYENGAKVMDWKKFTTKFIYGVMASGFTLAGATVMYFTLSGFTQKIALWGTVLAFTASMYLHMKEPDEG